jgi:hypothetical protein
MLQFTRGGENMKKISTGKYEISTTKADAIDKFIQMQGICREEISGEHAIEFYCSKKGKICITNPSTRHIENMNSTILYAEVIEQDGKTYVTYYTEFSRFTNIFKIIFLAVVIMIALFEIVFAITNVDKAGFSLISILGVVLFSWQLLNGTKEGKNSRTDSDILIKELERRVLAVKLWDK